MLLTELLSSTEAMQRVFCARASVQAMLDVEAALARAGAAVGLIPGGAADAIAGACVAGDINIAQLVEDGAVAGTVVIPLVKWLKLAVPDAAGFVHVGGTSQDIIDTAMVLQIKAGVALLQNDLAKMADAVAALAGKYAGTKMLGRTLLQPAMPVTFGLKAANWLVAISDSGQAVRHAAKEALLLQCGGAAGTLDALGERALGFMEAFGEALKLPVAVTPWHTRRAPLARLGAAIAGAVGVAGKIGTDIALMMQPEIGEVTEEQAPGRGSSSAMAHKRNPTLSIAARAAAVRMPGFAAMLLGAQDQEHERAAGGWQAEAATWSQLMLCASGGIVAMAEALPGLVVNEDAMARNLALCAAREIPEGVALLIGRALKDHHDK